MAIPESIGWFAPTSPTTLLASGSVLFIIYVLWHSYQRRIPSNAPPIVKYDLPLTGALGFWLKRWDFYKSSMRTPTGNFSFHAGPNTLIGLSGEKGRRLFFESKQLGFTQGYAVLFGATPPDMKDVVNLEETEDSGTLEFHKRLAYLLRTERFKKKLPTLISDVQECMDEIKRQPNGITDPFDSIYRVLFRLTIRMLGADEIAEDPDLLDSALKYFEMIDKSSTASTVMFPKFPSLALLKRTYAGANLYNMVRKIVKQRANKDEKHDDPLQYMLDQGDDLVGVTEFIVKSLFAGLLNSGINAAWVMCYIASSPKWMAETREEVRRTASKYASNQNAPLHIQLNDVPLEAWEGEFPLIDMCLRDSIRLNLLGSAFRKNVSGRPIPTGNGNEVIPPNAFVTYATADIHLNPEIYPDPETWDPSRYFPDRAEDKKAVHAYLGWGVARHPCGGMRFAKLEQNLITAYFLAAFDFHLQDEQGNKLHVAPKVDKNGYSAHKPKPRQFLKVTPREK